MLDAKIIVMCSIVTMPLICSFSCIYSWTSLAYFANLYAWCIVIIKIEHEIVSTAKFEQAAIFYKAE